MNYEDLCLPIQPIDVDIPEIVGMLSEVLSKINVRHLAYSGGIDSTIILCLLSHLFDGVSTYTISSRTDHPDAQFARLGSEKYNTKHREFIVEPTKADTDKFLGDNAVRQFYENVGEYTDKIICGDGIDEFMCGYYDHMKYPNVFTYRWFLSRLMPDHLIPLDKNSKGIGVFLPYLDGGLVSIFRNIPLAAKTDSEHRKKIISAIARHLNVPNEFITRNKYGFCDAFGEDKS